MFPILFRFIDLIRDEDACFTYLLEQSALDRFETCPSCSGPTALYEKSYRCRARNCRKKISVLKNSFFAKSRLECKEVLLMGYLWLAGCSHKTIHILTGHSKGTITDYIGHYRDLVSGCLDSNDTEIGGEGIVVEIDKSKFAKRKYHRRHRIEGC